MSMTEILEDSQNDVREWIKQGEHPKDIASRIVTQGKFWPAYVIGLSDSAPDVAFFRATLIHIQRKFHG